MAYVVIYVFDALSASPLAINPGSPFYPAQLALIETVKIVLPWLVPSVVGVAIVVIAILQDGF